MISNFGSRLGQMLHEKIADRLKSVSAPSTAPATAPDSPAPAAEPTPADAAGATPSDSSAAASMPSVEPSVATASPADAPSAQAQPEAATAAPEKSAEEQEEERLWAETDKAWAAGEFERVTELFDRLRELQPENAAEIDKKIAAAQYNAGAHFEQTGELARALYLFQEAQRRDPNLGEASQAIERVQNQINAAAQPAASDPSGATAPEARTYTVQSGDTLWAIAERFYGNGSEWNKIQDANRDQIQNPDMIQPGQVLTIP